MHTTIAEGIREHLGEHARVRTVTFEEPEHGLSDAVLAETDVLTWWGHIAHQRVDDAIVERVCERVLLGMGLVVLHSGHESKIFKRLMGTTCSLRWRESADREIVWKVNPGHPVARGLPEGFVIPEQEMYGEYFDIPRPDDLVFISSFAGGEVFRSGCAFRRGQGNIFYFSPGHETYPVYHQAEVRRVIANAVRWAAQGPLPPYRTFGKTVHSPAGWLEG
jgi:trehalose utilization protein